MIKLQTTQTHISNLLNGAVTYSDFQLGAGSTAQDGDEALSIFIASYPIISMLYKRTNLGDTENSDTLVYDIQLPSVPNQPVVVTEFALMAINQNNETYIAMYGFSDTGFPINTDMTGNLSGIAKMLVNNTLNLTLGGESIPFSLFLDHISQTPESLPNGSHGLYVTNDVIYINERAIAQIADLDEYANIITLHIDAIPGETVDVHGFTINQESNRLSFEEKDIAWITDIASNVSQSSNTNLFVNGNLDIWQRNDIATVTSTRRTAADRWQYRGLNSAGAATNMSAIRKTQSPIGAMYLSAIDSNLAACEFRQELGANFINAIYDYFRLYENLASMVTFTIIVNSGGSASQIFSYSMTLSQMLLNGSNPDIIPIYDLTPPISDQNAFGFDTVSGFFYFKVPAGAGRNYHIVHLKLELGSKFTGLSIRPVDTEYLDCQRYYLTTVDSGQLAMGKISGWVGSFTIVKNLSPKMVREPVGSGASDTTSNASITSQTFSADSITIVVSVAASGGDVFVSARRRWAYLEAEYTS